MLGDADSAAPLEILWLATKLPWPARDGGRLVQWETLTALAAAGHRVTVLAPRLVASAEDLAELGRIARVVAPAGRPRPWPVAALLALIRGLPLTVVRHRLPGVRRAILELAQRPFEVVHVEQLQALPAATRIEAPVVLRAQNVESDLWSGAAQVSSPLVAALLRRESARLRRFEAQALSRVQAAVTLTEADRERLAALAPQVRIEVVPPPFPPRLAAGPPRSGDPAIVLLAGSGWRPNEDAARWFLGEVWPQVLASSPRAHLHLFGGPRLAGRGVSTHLPPSDAAGAFADGALAVVPLRVGSGIRMKILESWARGLPVVATPTAAAGLEATDGRELLLADSPVAFGRAIALLSDNNGLREALVEAGRRQLVARHDPTSIAAQLVAIYRSPGRPAAG